MLANYSSSLSQPAIFGNSMTPSYINPVQDNSECQELKIKQRYTELTNHLLKAVINNQSSFLTFFLAFYVASSWPSYDLRLDDKDNVISPEVYKESQDFWWNKEHFFAIYNLEMTNRGREASAYMTVLMHHAVHSEDKKFLNYFFSSIDKNNLTSWSLIALLRSTSVYKNQIHLWKDLYLYTRDIVSKEGLNPKREMYGLDRGLSI